MKEEKNIKVRLGDCNLFSNNYSIITCYVFYVLLWNC